LPSALPHFGCPKVPLTLETLRITVAVNTFSWRSILLPAGQALPVGAV
jgi:hypothetical protein